MDFDKQDPITGARKEFLEMFLDALELSINDLYITHAVKCQQVKRFNYNFEDFSNCYGEWLKFELETIEPSHVIIAGRKVATILLNDNSIRAGDFSTFSKADTLVINDISYYLKSHDYEPLFKLAPLLKERWKLNE